MLTALVLLLAPATSCDNSGLTEECALHVFGTDEAPGADLTWQNPPAENKMTWPAAKQYCAGLSLDGHSDWRLPDIDELRSLIRGCPDTAACGVCKVNTNDCLDDSCRWGDDSCDGCTYFKGPADGCYWPNDMQGECGSYWSSSPVEDHPEVDTAWNVDFDTGRVDGSMVRDADGDFTLVCCVR